MRICPPTTIKPFQKVLKIPLLFLLICTFVSTTLYPVYSKTSGEIQDEIDQKQKELDELNKSLKDAQEKAAYYANAENNASSEIERIQNEMSQLDAEIAANQAEIDTTKGQIELKQLEIDQKNIVVNDKLIDLYIYNRRDLVDAVLESKQVDTLIKDVSYREAMLNVDIDGVGELVKESSDLENERASFEKALSVLEDENTSLAQQKEDLQNKMAYYSSQAAYNTSIQSGMRAQMTNVASQLEGLTAEQQAILDEEAAIGGDAHGGTKPLVSGEYYFYGRGWDSSGLPNSPQGHGLGFSQYGAYGGAQKGMNAQEIAQFYYPGSYIAYAFDSAVEERIKYLGEIPDKACGSVEQVTQRPDKYALYNPNNFWACWPEESIKAQVIVSRSYAYTGGTAQIFRSYKGKEWAVNETSGLVLKHNGSGDRDHVIKAFFSSDNSNGWGTATHRNPVWCPTFSGNNCVGYPWLQAVNDSSFAAKGPYTDWMWRTDSYTISELQSMLEWYANRGYYNSVDMRNLLNKIGTLNGFNIIRDVSGRCWKVEAIGSSGSGTINGEIFKQVFYLWVGNVQPSGEIDRIFSLTFHFVQVP